MATVTIADLFNAGRRITRMDGADYGSYWEGYRADSNSRRRQRNAAHKLRAEALLPWDAVIPAGDYGRITIGADGAIHYCAGQYAPTEYYWHVAECLRRLRQLRNAA
jgi:hypothetical protein